MSSRVTPSTVKDLCEQQHETVSQQSVWSLLISRTIFQMAAALAVLVASLF